jgi:hypothetical protein
MNVISRDEVIDLLQSNREALDQFGVESLALFGSVARDRLRKRSDIDILVRFKQPTWNNYIGLKYYLQDLLGRNVDLVTPKALKPATIPTIEKDLLYVIA